MRRACEKFAREYATTIVREGYRHLMLLHLCNLWDYALIDPHTMERCMGVIDDAANKPTGDDDDDGADEDDDDEEEEEEEEEAEKDDDIINVDDDDDDDEDELDDIDDVFNDVV